MQLAEEKDWRSAAGDRHARGLSAIPRAVSRPANGRKRRRCASTTSPPSAAARAVRRRRRAPAAAAAGEGGVGSRCRAAAPPAAAVSAFSSARFPRPSAPTKNGKSCRPMPRARSTASRRASSSAKPHGKTIYRLQAEVRDEAQARAICGGLKVANKPCVPVLPARALTERTAASSAAPDASLTDAARHFARRADPVRATRKSLIYLRLAALARALLCPTP